MNVTFLPKLKQITVNESCTMMELMMQQGIELDFVCGGRGTCGKCKVLITKGNKMAYTDAEYRTLTVKERSKGYRLACEFVVSEDTCVVLEERKAEKKHTVLSGENSRDLSEGTLEIAIDIGTTSLETAFLLNGKTIVARHTCVNPQRTYGMDVMSRLSYAMQGEEYSGRLQRVLLGALNEMINDFCRKFSISKKQITRIVVMGNTTMIYLLLHRSVSNLITPPFELDFKAFTGNASEYGFHVQDTCLLLVPSLIHGYVGSDMLGCILTTGIWKREGTFAIMDIGTNGEIAVSRNGKIAVCSTAAGPAFEGASIVQGMRVQTGAIYAVKRIGSKNWEVKTIGGVQARGICGSGLLDAVSVLRACDEIDSTGLMRQQKTALDSEGKVSLWQEDIRQFQLAKAAILAGFEVLLEEEKIALDEIDKIYVTGAFGSGLNVANAVHCGLFPKVAHDKFECISNGSLSGGIMLLKQLDLMEKTENIVSLVRHIELAQSEKFQKRFLFNMDFNDEIKK